MPGEYGGAYPITRNASCLARAHGIVAVVNVCDRQPCRKGARPCRGSSDVDCCPASGFELFNTELAFSETGELLAKYHKTHNYDTALDSGETGDGLCCWPPRLNYAYFDTSFGVRFGMHICFDILFRAPGMSLALDPALGIRDFVYSSHWEATGPPMLPALNVQQGWSRGVGVNLLAANAGEGYAHAGSGIYSKGKTLAAWYRPAVARDDHLLVARVPKLNKTFAGNVIISSEVASSNAFAPPVPAPAFQSFAVTPGSARSFVVAAAHGSFACQLTATLANDAFVSTIDRFLLMAVDGSWMGGVLPSRSCAVVHCGALPEDECAARASCANYTGSAKNGCPRGRSLYDSASDLTATTMFDSVELEGNFAPGDIVLPMVGTTTGQIVDAGAISVDGGRMRVALDAPLLNAMLFAVPETRGHGQPGRWKQNSVWV